jgi:hypothetical protein
MNFGIFAGGFASGFKDGMQIGEKLRRATDSAELRDVRTRGIMEAQSAYDAKVNSQINDTGEQKPVDASVQAKPVEMAQVETRDLPPITTESRAGMNPAATGIVPQAQPAPQTPPGALGLTGQPIEQAKPQGRYLVGDQRFETREAAKSASEKMVGPANDYILKHITPMLQQKYIEQGDLESAEKLGQYMESKKGREATALFSKGMTQLMTGNTEAGIKSFGEYYNKHIDDGVDFKSHTVGQDGKINITLAQKNGGKESQLSLSPKELLALGTAHDPAKNFALMLDMQKQQSAQAAEIAKEDRKFKQDIIKDDRKAQYAERLEGVKQKGRIEEKTIEQQLDLEKIGVGEKRKIEAKIEALRAAGKSEEFINEAMPQILGLGEYKKATSPEEARRLAHSDRMKNDMAYSRKTPGEQRKILDQDMALIFGGLTPSEAPSSSAPTTPKEGEKQGNMRPMLDTKTGRVVMRPAS